MTPQHQPQQIPNSSCLVQPLLLPKHAFSTWWSRAFHLRKLWTMSTTISLRTQIFIMWSQRVVAPKNFHQRMGNLLHSSLHEAMSKPPLISSMNFSPMSTLTQFATTSDNRGLSAHKRFRVPYLTGITSPLDWSGQGVIEVGRWGTGRGLYSWMSQSSISLALMGFSIVGGGKARL